MINKDDYAKVVLILWGDKILVIMSPYFILSNKLYLTGFDAELILDSTNMIEILWLLTRGHLIVEFILNAIETDKQKFYDYIDLINHKLEIRGYKIPS